ncbi:hypothetical protein A8M60_07390 [Nocardia farcinica]|nr:hypothetical protein A8M60_07390 [Nocardia farcinica]
MLHNAIEACLFSREVGHSADIVSMGGGFAVDYLDRRAWDRFRTQETGDWYFTGKPTASLYPYSSDPAGAHMLRRVLCDTDAGQGVAVAERARAHGLSIMAEPGRALCDGAGISVFTVRGVHAHPDGTDVITVSGTSLSLSEQWFGSEFLPDPELVSRHNSTPSAAPPAQQHPAVVAGSTCLDSDLLSRRRIPFARKPQVGDFVIYPNTAGYQMDSNESEFHQVPVPPKLTLNRTGTTTTWSLT